MNGEIEQRTVVEIMEMKVGGDNDRGQDVVDGPRSRQNRNNVFVTKKNVAEGMMDISLLTANANQLKFILYYSQESKMFYPTLVLIILSLILQVAVGILLIFRRRFKSAGQRSRASTMNENLVLLIFLTTLINILVAVFSSVENTSQRQ